MFSRMTCLVSLVLLLALGGGASALISWDDGGPDSLWSTPQNWNTDTVPTETDPASIDMPENTHCVVQEGIEAICETLRVGNGGVLTNLDITGGSLTAAETVVEEIRKAGGTAMANAADVSSFEQVKAMVEKATADWGSVDLLCANAGILRDKSFAKMELADFAWYLRSGPPAADGGLTTGPIVEYAQNLWDFANRLAGGAISGRREVRPKRAVVTASAPIDLSARLEDYRRDRKSAQAAIMDELKRSYTACIKEFINEERG